MKSLTCSNSREHAVFVLYYFYLLYQISFPVSEQSIIILLMQHNIIRNSFYITKVGFFPYSQAT